MARQRNFDESKRFLLGPEKIELLAVAGPSTTQQLHAIGSFGSSMCSAFVSFYSQELKRIEGKLALGKRGQMAREVEHHFSGDDICNNSVGICLSPLESPSSDPETATSVILVLEFLNIHRRVIPPCDGAVLPVIVSPDGQYLPEVIKSTYLEKLIIQLCHLLVHAAG